MYLTSRKKIKIESLCDSLWDDYQLYPGFDVKKDLILKLGIKCVEKELDGMSGLIVFDPSSESKAVISINKAEGKKRKRFSYAHELGHFFLHSNYEFKIDKKEMRRDHLSTTGEVIQEIEANYFAASLLVPFKHVEQVINLQKDFEENVEIVSRHFDVSITSTAIRLQNLGYV